MTLLRRTTPFGLLGATEGHSAKPTEALAIGGEAE